MKKTFIAIAMIATLFVGTAVKAEHGMFTKSAENPGIEFGENQLPNICITSLTESGTSVSINYELKDGCDPNGKNFEKYEALLRYTEDGMRIIFAIDKKKGEGTFYTEKVPAKNPSDEQSSKQVDELYKNEVAKNQNNATANVYRENAVASGNKKLKLANNITKVETLASAWIVFGSKKSAEGKTSTLQQIEAGAGLIRAFTGADYDRISANANIASMEGDCIATGGCANAQQQVLQPSYSPQQAVVAYQPQPYYNGGYYGGGYYGGVPGSLSTCNSNCMQQYNNGSYCNCQCQGACGN